MDTSEIYVEMCDCKEVREHTPITKHRGAIWVNAGETTVDIGSDRTVWLPRQDQIQRMMNYHQCPTCHTVKLGNFLEECINGWEEACMHNAHIEKDEKWQGATTMEQLWLEFYMQEEHHKRWDGKKWNKEGE